MRYLFLSFVVVFALSFASCGDEMSPDDEVPPVVTPTPAPTPDPEPSRPRVPGQADCPSGSILRGYSCPVNYSDVSECDVTCHPEPEPDPEPDPEPLSRCDGEVVIRESFLGNYIVSWRTREGAVPALTDEGRVCKDSGFFVRCLSGYLDGQFPGNRRFISDVNPSTGQRVYLQANSCSRCEKSPGRSWQFGWACAAPSFLPFEDTGTPETHRGYPSCEDYIRRRIPDGC